MRICRYVSFQRFCEMLFNSQIAMVAPDLWPDKYENYILQMLKKPEGKSKVLDFILKNSVATEEQAQKWISFLTYLCSTTRCLCFSQSYDSEVMWNAYSYGSQTIMWSTKEEQVYQINQGMLLEKVKYDLEISGYRKIIESCFATYQNGAMIQNFHELFIHKRSIFSYEQEVRIIDPSPHHETQKISYLNIPNLQDFIYDVMVHPLADDQYTETVKKMCSHFGIHFNGKSKIYEMNSLY